MKLTVSIASLLLTLTFAAPVWAHDDDSKKGGKSAAESTHAKLVDGEVRKVDMDAKKITVRHGPLTDLDMPAMTMVFQVKDVALLDKVKAGDKVKFAAQKEGGTFTITHIEPVK